MSLNHDDSQDAPQPKAKGKIATRRVARSLAMQALYQWHMAGQSLNEIEAQFRVDNDFSGVDGSYFHELLAGVARSKSEVDGAIAPISTVRWELDPVELAILRLSTYELMQRIDVPTAWSSTKASSWPRSMAPPTAQVRQRRADKLVHAAQRVRATTSAEGCSLLGEFG